MPLVTNHQKSESDHAFGPDQVVQILSLDGGGVKGLFSAAVIEKIEEQLGHSIGRHFDIITGTSTGGLIALSLGLGKSGKQIADFYKKDGPKIFPSVGLGGFARSCVSWCFSKYSNRQLKKTLQTLLKTEDGNGIPKLGDSKKRLIIPTFYAANSKPRLLKTPHDRRYRSDWKMPMWAVALATSAAPTYLPSFTYQGHTYLDGGLWANNPSLVGVVEAMEMGASLANIRVLNISTTSTARDCLVFSTPFIPLQISLAKMGKLPWASRILSTVMQADSFSTTHMYLRQMLAPGNLAAIDEQLNHGHADLDKINYSEFYTLGTCAGEQAKNALNSFFEHVAPDYTPNEEAIRDAPV